MMVVPRQPVAYSLFTDGRAWLFLTDDDKVLTASELPSTHFTTLNCPICPTGFTVESYSDKKNMTWTLAEALEERTKHHAR